MRRRRLAVLVVIVLCAGLVAVQPVVATSSADPSQQLSANGLEAPVIVGGPDEPIDVEYDFQLSESDPLVVEIAVEVPAEYEDRDGEFGIEIANAASVESDGFDEEFTQFTSGQYGTLVWDGETNEPTATIEIETIEGQHGSYNFYMDEEWGLIDAGFTAYYFEDGYEHPDAVVKSSTPDAATGQHMTYVGPHEEHEIDTGGETVRLIVPEGASIDEAEVSQALETAGTDLRVGARSNEVLAIAAEDPIRRGGLAYLHPYSDFWTHEDTSLSVWIHEYVHTRQAYWTSDSTEWLTEAEAEYLPEIQQYERGEISFEEFQNGLDPQDTWGSICSADDYEDVVLSDRGTWGTYSNYCKGQLVLAALDAEIREATDGERTYADVMREVNANHDRGNDPVTMNAFTAIVENVVGESMDVDAFVDTYIHDDAVPAVPDDPDVYGAWASFDTSLVATVGDGEPLVPGAETTAPVAVENEGSDPAVGVEMTLDVPDDWTVVDRGNGVPTEEGLYWSVSELNPGEELTDEVVLRAPDTIDQQPTLIVNDVDSGERTVTGESETIQPPTAVLTAEDAAIEGEPVTLDAGESEADGDIVEYGWDLTGDGEIDETTTEPTLEHVFDPGDHTVTVTVVDEYGFEDEAEATVVVTDIPEVTVDAPAAVLEGEPVELEALVDNDIGVYEVTWTFPDGETTGETVSRTLEPGEYELEVSVTDEYGAETSTTVSVTVTDVPELTVAAPETAIEGEPVELEALVENQVGTYDVSWTFPDGETLSGDRVSHTFEPGEHEIDVLVKDEFGATNATTVEVLVTDVPVLAVDAPAAVLEGEPVELEALVENEIGTYEVTWTFPDGETATGETATRTLEAGEHELEVRVEDEYGAETETTVLVAVGDGPTDDELENDAGDPTEDDATDDIPGFGPVVAVAAVLTWLAIRASMSTN